MTKMVIVVRKDLNMRKGKIAAQVAHAATGVLLGQMRGGASHEEYRSAVFDRKYDMTLQVQDKSPLDEWLRGSFRKICVSVNSEEELLTLRDKAMEQGLLHCLIVDNGLTEFHGVPTKTCLAIGPALDETLDAITGGLPLL